MVHEVLKQLEEAEARADETVREAQARAKAIVQDARATAKTIVDNAVAEATAEARATVEAQEALARAAAAEIVNGSASECQAMRDKARGRMQQAIEFVVERIVTTSGNC
ncbi:MAG: hypothetical protein ACOYW4_08670 [Bacillota bacterium]